MRLRERMPPPRDIAVLAAALERTGYVSSTVVPLSPRGPIPWPGISNYPQRVSRADADAAGPPSGSARSGLGCLHGPALVDSPTLQHGVQALSLKTRFHGPLVAQTPVRRLAQPCGGGSAPMRKVPANGAVRRRSWSDVAAPDSACHAGGRGFESRRSRLYKYLQIGCFCCLPATSLRTPRPIQQAARPYHQRGIPI
jgi:hypothetical protein